jgi:purine-binding chemotaxis protein CheW
MSQGLDTVRSGVPVAIPQARDGQGLASGDVLGAGSARYLTFVLSGEVYALPILDITEIMEFRSLTVVPMMPSFIRGVINLRGRVVPVVDMAARFGVGSTEVARRTSIIIVEAAGEDSDGARHAMGIMVDAVNKVVHLSAEDIEPPPAFGAGIRSDFISGMAKCNGEFIIVLDVSNVLSLDEMVLLGQAHQTGQAQFSGPAQLSGQSGEQKASGAVTTETMPAVTTEMSTAHG